MSILSLTGVFFSLFVIGNAQAFPVTGPRFVGTSSTEAILSFDSQVEVVSPANAPGRPSDSKTRAIIDQQLAYLIGPFHQERVAAAYGGHAITLLSTELKPGTRRTFRVSYRYEGRILLTYREGGGVSFDSRSFEVLLPSAPASVYERSKVNGRSRCTDGADVGAAYYFYHWNPNADGCPLKEGEDFFRIDATVTRMPNTVKSYPEYTKLVDPQGEMRVAVFFGKEKYEAEIPDPRGSQDWGAFDFTDFTSSLAQMGFSKRALSEAEIRGVAPKGSLPIVEEYVRTEAALPSGKSRTMRITVFFGETGLNHGSAAFHWFWKHALETTPVVIYQGHAGIGKNLHLKKIEELEGFRVELPQEKYQLLLLQACVSYSYYPRMYFQRKVSPSDPNGTLMLDILSNGAESHFGSNRLYSTALIKNLGLWLWKGVAVSYQEMAAAGRADYLFAISGDEDNPTRF
jgi:hypothetical protein